MSENKYFPGVEFPVLQKPEPPSEPVVPSDKLECRIEDQIAECVKIINAIKAGESDLHRGSVDINANTPVMQALGKLEANPTKRNLLSFLSVSKQDINLRAAQEFAKIFQHSYKDLQTLLIESGVM